MGYRVDTVPMLLRPLYLAVSTFLGSLLYLYFLFCHYTCRITHLGRRKVPDGSVVLCLWHTDWWLYVAAFPRHRRHIWINHPAAYMKPTHVLVRMMGVERLILGSEGREGAKAAHELADCLKQGYSTTISPDGPSGPPKVLKRGVLHIAEMSGAPIVPLRFEASYCLRLPRWDAKRLPIPFLSRISVIYGRPVYVRREDGDMANAVASQLAR